MNRRSRSKVAGLLAVTMLAANFTSMAAVPSAEERKATPKFVYG